MPSWASSLYTQAQHTGASHTTTMRPARVRQLSLKRYDRPIPAEPINRASSRRVSRARLFGQFKGGRRERDNNREPGSDLSAARASCARTKPEICGPVARAL